MLLRDSLYDVLLLDIWLPDRDGLDVLGEIRSFESESKPEVIMISGHGTIADAVEATRAGAFDFLEKPLSRDKVLLSVRHALDQSKLREENRRLREIAGSARMIGSCAAFERVLDQATMAARSDARVLLTGESGTGKELLAAHLHAESPFANGPFVKVNCAAIPTELIESELFGYRHGAVPGSPAEKRGTFERAGVGGTLFFNEAGDMSLKMQGKVLRALDEQRFTPVGATQPITVDVRVIAATNKDLEEEISKGNFRKRFFYRLNVIPFYVPPLRERKEDIHLLVREFLQEFGRQYGRPRIEMSEDAISVLRKYHWPGNVRELKNVIERVVILNPQTIRIERKHLPMLVYRGNGRRGEEFSTLQQAREAYERDYILRKVDECHGNVSRAAEALGLERSHLYRKMKALGISVRE